jgi:Acetyltransferase (GNAT) domain
MPSQLPGFPPLIDGVFSLELKVVSPHPVHKVPTYFFNMRDLTSGIELGRINLRVGSGEHIERYAGHIGYFVEPAHRGHAFASRALRLLTSVACVLAIDPLWITCDPENLASRRACERAGATLVDIVDVPADCVIYQSGHFKSADTDWTLTVRAWNPAGTQSSTLVYNRILVKVLASLSRDVRTKSGVG